jgi:hypothetical protein
MEASTTSCRAVTARVIGNSIVTNFGAIGPVSGACGRGLPGCGGFSIQGMSYCCRYVHLAPFAIRPAILYSLKTFTDEKVPEHLLKRTGRYSFPFSNAHIDKPFEQTISWVLV